MSPQNLRNKKPFKVLLCIPPAYDRYYPPLATPALCGFLKSKGIKACQIDSNISFFEYLKKNKLEHILNKRFRENKVRKKVYYWRDLSYRGDNALSYPFERVPGAAFDFTEKMLSSENLLRYLDDRKENIFLQFFLKKVINIIRREKFDMVGFSITAPSQVISSFTFSRVIKKVAPKIAVVIGGQWVSFFKEELIRRNDFSAFFDYAIYFEGETPIYSLVESLKHNLNLCDVPNLIYRRDGKFILSNKVIYEDMNTLPPPDFDGLPLKRYLSSPNNKTCSLTFEASRGCYWNRCTFCIDLPLPKPKYREKDIKLLMHDIKFLKRRYGVKTLIISSAVFSPWHMKRFSQELIKQKIRIEWWAWARFEKEFTEELLSLAKKAGCITLGFGLESINQRVLNFCDKGTNTNVIKRIINDAIAVKIKIFAQVIIGLPSETAQEALETIAFLIELLRKHKIGLAFNTYYLIPKNRIFNNPQKYGIDFKPDAKLPFKFFYPFSHTIGNVDRERAKKLLVIYSHFVKKKYKDRSYAHKK